MGREVGAREWRCLPPMIPPNTLLADHYPTLPPPILTRLSLSTLPPPTQISFGPITWLFVGEVFPLAARSRAAALATLTNFGANAAVSFALPSVQAAVGPAATYAGFAVIAAASVAVIWATVPETKGKTLEEIEAMFR